MPLDDNEMGRLVDSVYEKFAPMFARIDARLAALEEKVATSGVSASEDGESEEPETEGAGGSEYKAMDDFVAEFNRLHIAECEDFDDMVAHSIDNGYRTEKALRALIDREVPVKEGTSGGDEGDVDSSGNLVDRFVADFNRKFSKDCGDIDDVLQAILDQEGNFASGIDTIAEEHADRAIDRHNENESHGDGGLDSDGVIEVIEGHNFDDIVEKGVKSYFEDHYIESEDVRDFAEKVNEAIDGEFRDLMLKKVEEAVKAHIKDAIKAALG
jgi:hypothetical protein